ncbi:hypothetical protein JOF53_008016 [Crossiella equi]|uniref:SWIM-type domain-containing protein n=1 Tax=Crossiella equi TaxID=130796 RepID=A0ABS5ARE6_9PSEU|nr:hypothetical protein [Crossiella equi]MBP2479144.1 hypothetical protein [Crossiella equi]
MTDREQWAEILHGALEPLGLKAFLADPSSGFLCDRVRGLTVTPGSVTAEVQVTRQRRHRTRVTVPAHGKAAWARITEALAHDLSTDLLSGTVPPACAEPAYELLPDLAHESTVDCTCPAPAIPCGHLLATLATFAATAAEDPFLLFALRGRDREALLAELRAHHGVVVPLPARPAAAPLDADLTSFFDWPEGPVEPAAGAPAPVLDELPPLTATVAGVALAELLRPVYRAMVEDHPA